MPPVGRRVDADVIGRLGRRRRPNLPSREYVDFKAHHPGRRPGIHVLAVLLDVRWNLQRAPCRVDSRLRGNDGKG